MAYAQPLVESERYGHPSNARIFSSRVCNDIMMQMMTFRTRDKNPEIFFFSHLWAHPPRPRDRSILYIFCCQVSGKCSAGLYFRSGHSADVFLAAHGERFGRHSKSGALSDVQLVELLQTEIL